MLIHELLPDADALLQLRPEELSSVLIEHINTLVPGDPNLNWHNFFHHSRVTFHGFDARYDDQLRAAFAEAWAWLVREGLLVPDPMRGPEWYVVSRRGAQLRTRADADAYRRGNLLPREQLHPTIANRVWATFLRGDYDTVVFQAFKEVEVAVRKAASFSDENYGADLMRKAFHPTGGPLTDGGRLQSEREAMSALFAGAIGLYKNPHSHRNVVLRDPQEAVEMVILASHLLRIVDGRVDANDKTTATTGLSRHRFEYAPSEAPDAEHAPHIAFVGRLIHDATAFNSEGIPCMQMACYKTRGRQLVLLLSDAQADPGVIEHYATYETLPTLADDPELVRIIPKVDRVGFLDDLARILNEEWAVWID